VYLNWQFPFLVSGQLAIVLTTIFYWRPLSVWVGRIDQNYDFAFAPNHTPAALSRQVHIKIDLAVGHLLSFTTYCSPLLLAYYLDYIA